MKYWFQIGYIAQLVKCFLPNHGALNAVPRTKVEKADVVVAIVASVKKKQSPRVRVRN